MNKLNRLSIIIISFLVILQSNWLWAQERELLFRHLTIEDGLSHNNVHAILQDFSGFIWVATDDGLDRYDGYKIREYRYNPADSFSISSNYITCIYQSADSLLWIGTDENGLNVLFPSSGKFKHFISFKNDINSLSNNTIRCIYADKKSNIWIGTQGGGLNVLLPIAGGSWRVKRINIKDKQGKDIKSIKSIFDNGTGNLWLGTYGQGLVLLNSHTFKYQIFTMQNSSLSSDIVSRIIKDRAGNLWFATDDGLNLLNTPKMEFSVFRPVAKEENRGENIILDFHQDIYGQYWLATVNGLFLFDYKTGKFTRWGHRHDDGKSLSNNNLQCVLEDNAGVLWIGTFGGGINIVPAAPPPFFNLKLSILLHKQNINNTIRSIYESPLQNERILWIGSLEEGLIEYKPSNTKVIQYKHQAEQKFSIPEGSVTNILLDQNSGLWIATCSGGLAKGIINRKTNRIEKFISYKNKGLKNNCIKSLFKDSHGFLWVGTEAGMALYDAPSDSFIRLKQSFSDLDKIQSNCILEDDENNLWIGSWGGLRYMEIDRTKQSSKEIVADIKFIDFKNNLKDLHSIGSNHIISMSFDKNGELWIGTAGGGLSHAILDKEFKMNTKKVSFDNYTRRQGLPNNVIYYIAADNKNHLWMTTNRGLSRFSIISKHFDNYDRRDGLQGDKFFWGAGFQNEKGELFLGGEQGISIFNPESIQANTLVPKIIFTQLDVDNKKIKPKQIVNGRVVLNKPLFLTKELILTHKEKKITIYFSAIHFLSPEKNRYSYILEGMEQNWGYSDYQRNFVSYSNLKAGTYTFKVKAANSDGIWMPKPAELKIIVLPPWWETAWFRVLFILAIIGFGYGFYRFKVIQMKRRQKELERIVAERTDDLNEANVILEERQEEILQQNEEIQAQNAQILEINNSLEFKNQIITGSIHYAQTIQSALLPMTANMKKELDLFVLLCPKDIVSGDFYWWGKEKDEIKGKEYIFIAAVDCTGHGVPGAFMSMISYSLLNEIVRVEKEFRPDRILARLEDKIVKALKQNETENKDGMDIAFCRLEKINQKEYEVLFAGAKRPLFYTENGKIIRIRGSRHSIGGTDLRNEKVFDLRIFRFPVSTTLYIGSDGYIDQNDAKRKRLGTDSYIKILERIQNLSMDAQKEELKKYLDDLLAGTEQRDDILIIGIKL